MSDILAKYSCALLELFSCKVAPPTASTAHRAPLQRNGRGCLDGVGERAPEEAPQARGGGRTPGSPTFSLAFSTFVHGDPPHPPSAPSHPSLHATSSRKSSLTHSQLELVWNHLLFRISRKLRPMSRRLRSLFLSAISPGPRTVSGTELALSRYLTYR